MPALLFALVVLLIVTTAIALALRRARRAEFIRAYVFPRGLFAALQQKHPQLSQKDCQLVGQALRQFFDAYLRGGGKRVAMPSQVADDLWHAFILYTRHYDAFCKRAFGRFLHHTPAVVMGGERASNERLRRCWWHCCRAENIDPRAPSRLPLLFAIDAKLKIAGGFHYAPNCGPIRAQAGGDGGGGVVIHCGTDFSDDAFEGGSEGFDGRSSDGGGDGGGGDGGGCSS